MTVHIQLPDDQAATLQLKAAAEGLTLENWLQKLAERQFTNWGGALMSGAGQESVQQITAQEAVLCMLELQKHVKPDPEGWTASDYVHYGRR